MASTLLGNVVCGVQVTQNLECYAKSYRHHSVDNEGILKVVRKHAMNSIYFSQVALRPCWQCIRIETTRSTITAGSVRDDGGVNDGGDFVHGKESIFFSIVWWQETETHFWLLRTRLTRILIRK